MRGLNTRVYLAHARIISITDPNNGAIEVAAALCLAQGDGFCDYLDGLRKPPVMFQDEPLLLANWNNGQDDAAKNDEFEVGSSEWCSIELAKLAHFDQELAEHETHMEDWRKETVLRDLKNAEFEDWCSRTLAEQGLLY